MKFFLISDNVDTQIGLRLAGIEGVVVHEAEPAIQALRGAIADPDIAVVLITEGMARLCRELVDSLKLQGGGTLIVEIPDRHGNGRAKDSITRYIQEAVGIKI